MQYHLKHKIAKPVATGSEVDQSTPGPRLTISALAKHDALQAQLFLGSRIAIILSVRWRSDMEVQFVDRILICSDCHGEFVFTAGEQLFFHDKQFKNDPKRCKPCKSRRTGLSDGANGAGPAAAGLSRTETRTECSECGVQTTVPFKPTQGRPVLCRQCFQAKGKGVGASPGVTAASPVVSSPMTLSPAQAASAQSSASAEPSVEIHSANGALSAAASMAPSSRQSSVASTTDLASMTPVHPTTPITQIPTELLAAASSEMGSSEKTAPRVDAAEA